MFIDVAWAISSFEVTGDSDDLTEVLISELIKREQALHFTEAIVRTLFFLWFDVLYIFSAQKIPPIYEDHC